MIVRTDAFGDTMQFGLGSAAGSASVKNMWFNEPQNYTYGTTTKLPFTAGTYLQINTAPAHIRFYASQGASVDNSYFSNMPVGVAVNGGSLFSFSRNKTWAVWDSLHSNLQEGLAALGLFHDVTYGGVKDVSIVNNQGIGGYKTGAETVSISSTCGTSTPSLVRAIGPKYGVYADDGETVDISGNFFGTQAYNALNIFAANTIVGWRVHGNKFDDGSYLDAQIRLWGDGSKYGMSNIISNNEFNGELVGLNAVFIDEPGSAVSQYGVSIIGNTMHAFIGAPIKVLGGNTVNVLGNTVSDYNTLNTCVTDAQFAAGMYVGGVAANVTTFGNTWGGGGNTFDHGTGDHTAWGVYSDVANVGTFGPDYSNGLLTALYGGPATTKPVAIKGRLGVNYNAPDAPLAVQSESDGADAFTVHATSNGNFLTIKPETTSGTAVIGYYKPASSAFGALQLANSTGYMSLPAGTGTLLSTLGGSITGGPFSVASTDTGNANTASITANDVSSGAPISTWASNAYNVLAGPAIGGDGNLATSYNSTTHTAYLSSLAPGVAWRNLTIQSGGGVLALGASATTNIGMSGGAVNVAATTFKSYTVSGLPTGATGMVAAISDGNAACTIGSAIPAGGGSTKCLAWYNGASWTVIGK